MSPIWMYIEPTLNRGNTRALLLSSLEYMAWMFLMESTGENSIASSHSSTLSYRMSMYWICPAMIIDYSLFIDYSRKFSVIKILIVCFVKNISYSSDQIFVFSLESVTIMWTDQKLSIPCSSGQVLTWKLNKCYNFHS